MNRRFKKVAVLMGGVSSERKVSLKSGTAIAQGLREGGYEVVEVDITARDFSIPDGVEAVFIALHGAFGEDGEIQQILAARGMPFTGSGAESCRVSFDKVLTRDRLEENGIPVPKGELIKAAGERTLPVPLVVKPPREGSSVGCHIVFEETDWDAAFSDAVQFSDTALVEEYIPGRELTVGIVERGDSSSDLKTVSELQVLPVVEIKTASEWYDYEAKYVTGETQYVVPAELTSEVTENLQALALKTFECLNARGCARVDFRLSPEDRPYILELNAIPGFTASSLLPKAADAAGVEFSELCCRIMEMARNHADRK